jgi:hypothetical protein
VIQSIQLDEAELNRLLNYAVELRQVNGIAAELTPGLATLTATLAVPSNPFGRYLNLTAEVAEVPGGIRIQSLQLGSLPVPGALADGMARLAHRWLRRDETYATLADAFAKVSFDENMATLDYRWHPELLTQVERKSAELLIAPEDQARMLAYAEQLDALLKPYPHGSTVPLTEVVPLLFAQSGRRQRGRGKPCRFHRAGCLSFRHQPAQAAGRRQPVDPPGAACAAVAARPARLRRALRDFRRAGRQRRQPAGQRHRPDQGGRGRQQGVGLQLHRPGRQPRRRQLGERATGEAAVRRCSNGWLAARSDADLLPDFATCRNSCRRPNSTAASGQSAAPAT